MVAKSDRVQALTGAQLRKLHAALRKALETTAVNTTTEIAATFQQDTANLQTYLSAVTVHSDSGLDTKLTMIPFLRYLDTDNELELNIGNLDFSVSLTTKALLWTEWDTTLFKNSLQTCCLEQNPNTMIQVYTNNKHIALKGYQSLSRLLYCDQLQLNETEYIMSVDKVTVKVTGPIISISDYQSVPPSQIRICADAYIKKAHEKKTSHGSLVTTPWGLLVLGLVLAILLIFGSVLALGSRFHANHYRPDLRFTQRNITPQDEDKL